ncbi:hypothetical protein C5B93_09550 [Rathayibacter sp. AY1A2]|nr:hypothetical protein C5B93_09550 [Rathayibacter sp. AY1A2]
MREIETTEKHCRGAQILKRSNTTPKEAGLRDALAENLNVVGEELSLIKVEYHLRNTNGASGSIDILARDGRGDLVIIELKRADQTARQALHELEKYVALLAQNHGIRTDQLRCILISTTWHELAVPFSRYQSHADFYLTGLELILDSSGTILRCDPVIPSKLSAGLDLCPSYFGMLFESAEARDLSVKQAKDALLLSDVEDFILLSLDYSGSDERVIFPYANFLALSKFDQAMREHISLHFSEDAIDEFEPEDYWQEELVQTHLSRIIECDEVSISTPYQLGVLETWSLVVTEGSGVFADPLVWPSERLLELVSGSRSRYAMNYSDQVVPANRPAWLKLLGNVDQVTRGTDPWPQIIHSWLEEAEHIGAEVRLNIYCPQSILYGLFKIARDRDASFIPEITLARKHRVTGTLVRGSIAWDGIVRDISITELLSTFDLDFLDYMTAHGLGENIELEQKMLIALGLRYVALEPTGLSRNGLVDELRELSVEGHGSLARSVPIIKEHRSPEEFLGAHPLFRESLLSAFGTKVIGI